MFVTPTCGIAVTVEHHLGSKLRDDEAPAIARERITSH